MKVALTVRDHLSRAAAVYPERVAVIDEPDQPAPPIEGLTYGRMATLAQEQGAALDALGVPFGGRVVMVTQNAARLSVAYFGVSGHGRVLVPVNFRLSRDEIAYIVDHAGADVVLVDPEVADSLGGIDSLGGPGVRHRFVLGAESDAAMFLPGVEPVPWTPDEDAIATLNYTSGTTARPKGVAQTHRALWCNSAVFGWQVGVNDRDVYLHTLPMFHCNGWGMPYATTAMGVTQVVLRRVDGAEILRRVERHGVTLLCGAPAVVNAILDAAATWPGEVPGRGRVRMVVAGAPPPTRTIERMETELGWEFIQIYGLTETAPLSTINRTRAEWDDLSPSARAAKLGRAGVPAFGMEMAASADGEVLHRGNHVLDAYWQDPAATDAAIVDGWFRSGDGGAFDDEGYLVLADRRKDVIISGGENVSSIEVEDALFSHPAVAEVAVIGVPHEKWGETIKALVVLAPGAEVGEQDLVEHCRARIAHYKCPTSVEFRTELARTATGKLQKFKLREPYWDGYERAIN
jgi:fatty-acyl-CoA synthase